MLVRNLRRVGDYERAILSQEENLKMAIANDRNVSQARAQLTMGMLPELTEQQKRSKEEELTDILSNEAKAMENLLSLFPREKATEFMNELNDDALTYMNVYWSELKPKLKDKTGLNARFFKRIIEDHIKGVTNNRGMSTVPSTGAKNASLNESEEAKRIGIYWLRDSNYIRKIVGKLNKINTPASREFVNGLNGLKRNLPTDETIRKADAKGEAFKQEFYQTLIDIFQFAPEEAWNDAAEDPSPQSTLRKASMLFDMLTPREEAGLQRLYREVNEP
jgi:hypothetical protein